MSAAERLAPASETEIAEIVQAAKGREVLRIEGNGTLRSWGPANNAVRRLSTAELTGIVFYEPEELVLAVRPGTTVAEVNSILRQSGQALAFEPPDLGPLWGSPSEHGTIGGTIAANLAGPRRWKAGAARDHLLGLRAVNGRGEVYRAGARVMKNVTGFDLPKLLAGSFGRLSVLTELTLKVLPRPEHERTLVLTGLDIEVGCAALRAAVASPFEPSAAAFLPERAARTAGLVEPAAVLRFEGTELSIRSRIAAVRHVLPDWSSAEELDAGQGPRVWRSVRDATVFTAAFGEAPPLWRLSVPPAHGPFVAQSLAKTLPVTLLLDWVGGLVWVQIDEPVEDCGASIVDAAIAASGGHATLLRGSEALRSRTARNAEPPITVLSEQLRRAFDPEGVFAPA